jgi:glutathione S-transferase
MIQLIGSPITRAQRTMWMLEELELPYELIPASVPTVQVERPLLEREEIEQLNPSGKVPILVDGELTLTESFGINLYLAMKYPSELTPKSPEEWGRAQQWTAWIATEIENDLTAVTVVRRSGLLANMNEQQRQNDALLMWGLRERLKVLDHGLAGRDWLLGDRFTVADLNVAAPLALARPAGVDFGDLTNALKWLDRCLARPAARSAWGKVIEDAKALGFIGNLDVPGAS